MFDSRYFVVNPASASPPSAQPDQAEPAYLTREMLEKHVAEVKKANVDLAKAYQDMKAREKVLEHERIRQATEIAKLKSGARVSVQLEGNAARIVVRADSISDVDQFAASVLRRIHKDDGLILVQYERIADDDDDDDDDESDEDD